MALASVLVQYGSATFDSVSGSTIIHSLLSKLDEQSVLSHVKFLCGVIGSSAANVRGANGGDNEEDEDDEELKALQTSAAASALEALVLLAKNSQLEHRALISVISLSVLLRISCFEGKITIPVSSTASKKKNKKSKNEAAVSDHHLVPQSMWEAALDCVALTESEGHIQQQLRTLASNRLLALSSDLGLHEFNKSRSNEVTNVPDGVEGGQNGTTKKTYLDVIFYLLTQLSTLFALVNKSVEGEEEDEAPSTVSVVTQAKELMASTISMPSSRIADSLSHFLTMACLQTLCTEVPIEALDDICSVVAFLIPKLKARVSKELIEDDEGKLELLFEASIELTTGSTGDQPLKAVRECTKRVWNELCHCLLIDEALLKAIVAKVVQNAKGSEVIDEEEEDDGEDDDEEDDDEEEVGDDENEKSSAKSEADNEEEDDEVEEEDNEEGMLLHDETADAALAEMIRLRQKGKKQNVLAERRAALDVSTRCVDLLDILFRSCEYADMVIPLLNPLLSTLKTVVSYAPIMGTQEGKSFDSRLRALLETRICKGKLRLLRPLEEECVASLLDSILTYMKSPVLSLRLLGSNCLITLLRIASSGSDGATLRRVGDLLVQLLNEYLGKKHSSLTSKIFEDVLLRYPDLFVAHLGDTITVGMRSGKSPFLRTEAFRLYSSVFKKFKMLSQKSQETLLKSIMSFVAVVESALASKEEDGKALKSKHVGVVFSACREISSVLVSVELSAGVKACGNAIKQLKGIMESHLSNAKGKLEGAVKNLTQLLASIDIAPSNEVEKEKKKKKKRAEDEGHGASDTVVAQEVKAVDKKSSKKAKKEV